MYQNQNFISTYALPFAAWELRLYLDTHPGDTCALATYKSLCAMGKAGGSYADLPQKESDGGWNWVDGKWPWEYGASCPCASACDRRNHTSGKNACCLQSGEREDAPCARPQPSYGCKGRG